MILFPSFFLLTISPPPRSTLFPYTTLFRSCDARRPHDGLRRPDGIGGRQVQGRRLRARKAVLDRKSTRLNSSHLGISYAVFCLKKKKVRLNIISQRRRLQNQATLWDIDMRY